jgi:hypothetical protein
MRDDSGQSLVVVVIAMTVIIGIAALAIDASSWFERHHQAQVVADSAALAAANCLANPGTGSIQMGGQSYARCSSSTDSTDAQNLAVGYAQVNGFTITTNNVVVNTAAGTVTVTAGTNAPAFFGTIFGIFTSTQTAKATASYGYVTLPSSVYAQACATPGTGQLTAALTAPCTVDCSQTGIGIDANNITITGAIGTNGSINVKKNNGQGTQGDVLYGDPAPGGPNCQTSNPGNTGTSKLSTQYGINEESAFSYYPDTYYNKLNAGTDCVASSTALTSAYPNSVTVNTTTKTITFTGTIGSSSSLANIAICAALSTNWAYGYSIVVNQQLGLYGVTLTGPSISFASPANGVTVQGDANYTPDGGGTSPTLAIFDTTTTQASMGSGNNSDNAGLILGSYPTAGNNFTISGAVWAPIGGILLPGNNGATGALIEANTVVLAGNNAGGGTAVTVPESGTDQLTQ